MENNYKSVLHLDGVSVYLPDGTFEKPITGGLWKHGKGYTGKSFKFHKNGISLTVKESGGKMNGSISGSLFDFGGLKGSFDLLYEVLESLNANPDAVHIQQIEVALTVLDKDTENTVFRRFCEKIVKDDSQNCFGSYYPFGKKDKRSNVFLDSFVLVGGKIYPKDITAAMLGGSGKRIEYRALRAELVVENKGAEQKTFSQLEDIFLSNLISSITVKFITMVKGITLDTLPTLSEYSTKAAYEKAYMAACILKVGKDREILKKQRKVLKKANEQKIKVKKNEYEALRVQMLECLGGV